MTLQDRLRSLCKELGISKETVGSQGIVTIRSWAKIENGRRSPSEELIMSLIGWLLEDERLNMDRAARILEELLTLKHLDSRSFFVRHLARKHAENLYDEQPFRLAEEPAIYQAKRRRQPPRAKKRGQ